MSPLVNAGAVLFGVFSAVAAVDGFYFHIWKYRLHTRPDSHLEHVTHTLNAILFPPLVYLLLLRQSAGPALWGAVAIVIADFIVESWDVLIERASRAGLGGLTPIESWIHVTAVTSRTGSIAVLLAARPVWAWSPAAASSTMNHGWIAWLAIALIAGGAVTAIEHVWLLQPRYRYPVGEPVTPSERPPAA